MVTRSERGQSLIELLLISFFLVSFLLGFAALAGSSIEAQQKFRFQKHKAEVRRVFRFS
jgi:Tfp pilus assembly protein PilV